MREGGFFGLWRSVVPSIVRDGPGVGIYLLTFDVAKKFLSKYGQGFHNKTKVLSSESEPPKLWMKMLAGSFAGIAYWIYALPVDTMKTLIENSSNVATGPKALIRLACHILRDGGVCRLFRAWPVAFGRGIPAAAVTLTTYDLAADYFVQRRLRSY
jgi:hypothetical protein